MKHPCADLAGSLLCLAACCALLTSCGNAASAPTADFVRVEEGRFLLGDEPCYFVGTNFWYGPILGSEGPGGDRARLERELDTLAACGLRNLRVLVGAEGPAGVPSKIAPILQPAPGRYDDALLDGLDYFMQQLALRDMKAVLYLTNSWEWSGGYSQYLAWAGAGEAAIPAVDGYRAYVDYVSQFIPDARARALYADHVRFIVGRTNRYTGVRYADDPTIFSWQICNEPRPFGEENHEAFAEWIGETARLIRSLDPNHLISTGSEGIVGCEGDDALTERIHAFPEIDYINIHIWPSNWQWVDKEHLAEGMDNALALTDRYIDQHLTIAERLRKPVVIEEFGFPRDDCAPQARGDRGVRLPARRLPLRAGHADDAARPLLRCPARTAARLGGGGRTARRRQLLGLGRRGAARTPRLAAGRPLLRRPGPGAAGPLLGLRRRHDGRPAA